MIIRQWEILEEPLGEKSVSVMPLLTRQEHSEAVSVTRVCMAARCCQRMSCELRDRVCYLLSGQREFQVGEEEPENVAGGDLVFVPKAVPYSFRGRMRYLVIDVPPFVPGSDITVGQGRLGPKIERR